MYRDRDFCLESDENICLLLWEKLLLIVVHSHGRAEWFNGTVPGQVNSLYRDWTQMENGNRKKVTAFYIFWEHFVNIWKAALTFLMQKDSKPNFLELKNKLLFSDSQLFLSHFRLELAKLTKIRPHGHGNTDIRQKTTNTERLTSF